MPLLIGILVLGVGAIAYFAGAAQGALAQVAPGALPPGAGANPQGVALPPPGAAPPPGTPLTPAPASTTPPVPGTSPASPLRAPQTLTLIPGGMHVEMKKGESLVLLIGMNGNWIEPLQYDPAVFAPGSIPTEGPNPAQVHFLGGAGDLVATWLPPSILPFGLLQVPAMTTTVHVREAAPVATSSATTGYEIYTEEPPEEMS
jgi:hypothetical protein